MTTHITVPNFVHLHLHTQFSLLDAMTQISPLVDKVAEIGMPAVAVTDHGNMFGALDFYKTAKKKGIKPIIGVEAYVVPEDHTEKKIKQRYTHLILLAINDIGYRNLCRLISASYIHGFYRRPRMDKKLLREHNEGLIALSACLRGPLNDYLVQDKFDMAEQEAMDLVKIFAPEDSRRPTETSRFFLELQDHGIGLQHKCNEGLRELAKKLSLPLVITNDSHYLCPDDYKPHDVLLCIGQGKSFVDANRKSVYNTEFYLKNALEMSQLFPKDHEALNHTMHIAERCNFNWKFGEYRFPKYTKPGDEENSQIDYNDEMRTLARQGLSKRLEKLKKRWVEYNKFEQKTIDSKITEYKERLEVELECIVKMGFAGYFLIVQDFINWAKDQDIPVGPGRGSAAGSLVAYAMRITDIDPIEYDLLFQRFLNPERISMPDIDVDFCMRKREDVIRYVHGRYGGDKRVCQIVTFGKMLARGVIKDVGRAMEIPYADVDKLSKLVPETLGIKLKDAIDQEPRFQDMVLADPRIGQLLEYAQKLEGVARHTSMHAAGVVICDVDLADVIPLYKVGDDGVVTQFDMKGAETVGLIKFDFLGLKTLDQIQYAVQLINKDRIKEKSSELFSIDDIPIDDEMSYNLLKSGDTVGVFQLESDGMRELMIKLKPSTIEDVIALVALYRPGPLQSGMVDDFVDRKHGRKKVTYQFPQLEPILKNTYGVIVYQEQVMMIASSLANYSLGEADLLRRAMGKKDAAEMARQKDRFLQGAKENNLDIKKAEEIFDLMAKFAEYGFNKSHSAAYGYIAYQTAYLKANNPACFFASLLSIESDNTDKVFQYVNDARDAKIDVLPPDINSSDKYFTVKNNCIVYGLIALKGVGEGAVDAILEARKKQSKPFSSMIELCTAVEGKKLNKKVLENLAKSGAFDSFGETRATLFNSIEAVMDTAQAHQKEQNSSQISLFATIFATNEQPRPILKQAKLPEWIQTEKLAHEKEALGFYFSGHPMNQYRDDIKKFAKGNLQEISKMPDGKEVVIAGTLLSCKIITTKKGDRMAALVIEDMFSSMEVIVFPRTYQNYITILSECKDQPLLIKGVLDGSGDAVKLRANDIQYLSSVRESKTEKIALKFNLRTLEERILLDLEKLLKKHKGETTSVELHIINDGVVAQIADDSVKNLIAKLSLRNYKLKISEAFIQELERLCGAGIISYSE